MIEGIHKHLLSELDRAGRTDTVFVLAGVCFNLLILFVNWIQASRITSDYQNNDQDAPFIFALFLLGTLVVSSACLLTLANSRNICVKLHESLMKIYEKTNVAEFIPADIGSLGNKRFILSFIVVGGTGLLAVLVPFITIWTN
ncbi:hypothetical protein [Pseudohongiella sp. O18]|uniref:hypothetical protein n=1 Tax=Pseudohongiella sp. O18 TaxID=2904248 RepID=UPI001F322F71|nr:hypothetical protein [Pseudohongiella sp. O18]